MSFCPCYWQQIIERDPSCLTVEQLQPKIIEYIESGIAAEFGVNTKMSSPHIKPLSLGECTVLHINYVLNGSQKRLYSAFINVDGSWSVRDMSAHRKK